MVPEGRATTGPLYQLLPEWLVNPGIPSLIVVVLIVLGMAMLLNGLAGRNRLSESRNWLVGMGIALVAVYFPEQQRISPPLLASVLLPLILQESFGLYKKLQVVATTFNLGFLVGLGSLIFPPFILTLAPVLLGTRILRSYKIYERLVLLVGVFVPLFLFWTGCYWFEETEWFLTSMADGLRLRLYPDLAFTTREWIKVGMIFLSLLVLLLSSGNFIRKQLMQSRKYISVILWFLFFSLLGVWCFDQPVYTQFALVVPSLGALLGLSFASMRNTSLAELLHLIFLAGIFMILYYPF